RTGGEGGIRTRETVSLLVFETSAFNHSATSPRSSLTGHPRSRQGPGPAASTIVAGRSASDERVEAVGRGGGARVRALVVLAAQFRVGLVALGAALVPGDGEALLRPFEARSRATRGTASGLGQALDLLLGVGRQQLPGGEEPQRRAGVDGEYGGELH